VPIWGADSAAMIYPLPPGHGGDVVGIGVVVVVVVVVVAGGGQAGGWYPFGGSSPPGRGVDRLAIMYPCPAGQGGGAGGGVVVPLGLGYPFWLLAACSVLSM